MKKSWTGTLLVVLFASLLLNVYQLLGVGKIKKSTPWVGIYICGDERNGATYIVLTAEKEFYRYQQFKMLEESSYTMDETGAVTVESDEDTVLIDSDRGLYFIRDGKADLYERKSDTPTFVNVDQSTGAP